MSVTTKFLITTIEVAGTFLWVAVIYKLEIIYLLGELFALVFNP